MKKEKVERTLELGHFGGGGGGGPELKVLEFKVILLLGGLLGFPGPVAAPFEPYC